MPRTANYRAYAQLEGDPLVARYLQPGKRLESGGVAADNGCIVTQDLSHPQHTHVKEGRFKVAQTVTACAGLKSCPL